ncbi:MAG: Selenide, water dikinase [Syntrophorhabdaceae bacterium PtaU1.Bin034]|nr:MAG: Selenide, water dikinase [Syntrophorhabdaceae bacterium PtaU1.Bin034]
MCGVEIPADENVIVGIEGFEDAGVYRINDETALVQTVDFFTPVVDDPYYFGQIAAANSFSDIYAMGAVPRTAMNIVCFSPKTYDIKILKEIIRGGADKIREAGASLLGGHSVDDQEIKYGLSVTGVVHPQKVVRNEGAQPDDLLILTKPLGTGILNTAIKGDMLGEDAVKELIEVMSMLNRRAADAMREVRTHAATDVTGFGLAGHLSEMLKDTVGVKLFPDKIPYFKEAPELSRSGFAPGGLYRNRDFYGKWVIGASDTFLSDILFDPQTSGGLLIAIHPDDLGKFDKAASRYESAFWVIGQFVAEPKGKIVL